MARLLHDDGVGLPSVEASLRALARCELLHPGVADASHVTAFHAGSLGWFDEGLIEAWVLDVLCARGKLPRDTPVPGNGGSRSVWRSTTG